MSFEKTILETITKKEEIANLTESNGKQTNTNGLLDAEIVNLLKGVTLKEEYNYADYDEDEIADDGAENEDSEDEYMETDSEPEYDVEDESEFDDEQGDSDFDMDADMDMESEYDVDYDATDIDTDDEYETIDLEDATAEEVIDYLKSMPEDEEYVVAKSPKYTVSKSGSADSADMGVYENKKRGTSSKNKRKSTMKEDWMKELDAQLNEIEKDLGNGYFDDNANEEQDDTDEDFIIELVMDEEETDEEEQETRTAKRGRRATDEAGKYGCSEAVNKLKRRGHRLGEEVNRLRRKNQTLSESFTKAIRSYKKSQKDQLALRESLQGYKLENAKLANVARLMLEHNLDGKLKKSIMSKINSAKTIKECATIYKKANTLLEQREAKKANVNENAVTKKFAKENKNNVSKVKVVTESKENAVNENEIPMSPQAAEFAKRAKTILTYKI